MQSLAGVSSPWRSQPLRLVTTHEEGVPGLNLRWQHGCNAKKAAETPMALSQSPMVPLCCTAALEHHLHPSVLPSPLAGTSSHSSARSNPSALKCQGAPF